MNLQDFDDMKRKVEKERKQAYEQITDVPQASRQAFYHKPYTCDYGEHGKKVLKRWI